MFVDTPSSSAISSLDWDEETTDLTVTFVKGGAWLYRSFPYRMFLAWVNAPSTGGYYNSTIRGRFGGPEDRGAFGGPMQGPGF